jgi:TAG lipase / steryl ester hydrolase / phospholipase A2 / LPA acyltransferase
MLTNPTPEEFRSYTLMGERATWPRMSMIRDRTRLSRAFGNAIGALMRRTDSAAAKAGRPARVRRT